MSALFLSDVHLRDGSSLKAQLVIRFLQQIASQHENIYVLGDLFDVWPGTTAHLVLLFRPVLQALKQLVVDGHQVIYIEGNHDFALGNFFTHSLGVQVHANHCSDTWNGKKIYMAHGDLANPSQLGYRFFRFVLRHKLIQFGKGLFPQDFIFQVGLNSSRLSRRYQDQRPNIGQQVREIYRRSAQQLFWKGYDVVLMGHTHLPDDFTIDVDGRQCRYINTGDWIKHFTYLVFDGVEFYTKIHPVTAL